MMGAFAAVNDQCGAMRWHDTASDVLDPVIVTELSHSILTAVAVFVAKRLVVSLVAVRIGLQLVMVPVDSLFFLEKMEAVPSTSGSSSAV